MDINGIVGDVSGDGKYKGELFRVRGISGIFVTQAPYVAITWVNPATVAGSRCDRGRTQHIFGVLP